jgi:hypothetical protein
MDSGVERGLETVGRTKVREGHLALKPRFKEEK